MTWARLPKTKKSYHSKAVPVAEAATTVRSELAPVLASRPAAAWSAIPVSLPLRRNL